jgi:hypothetical protein
MTGTLAAGCTPGRSTPRLEPVAVDEDGDDDELTVEYTTTQACPTGTQPYLAGVLRGDVRGDGTGSAARLTLRRP